MLSSLAMSPAAAQFDQVPIPAEVSQLEFLIGEWTVEGRFRTPDVIGEDRTLWFRTDRGVTRFDGRNWSAWEAGADPVADSILARIKQHGAGEPFVFSHPRATRWIQDGFALLMDDGRTSGTRVLYYDANRSVWGERSFHAPSGGFGFRESTGTVMNGILHLEGTGVDRRGERLIRTRFVPDGPDAYTVRTDVSFDEGQHWLLDQSVMKVVHQ